MHTSGARVLIVDDDPASRRLLEVRLRPLECDVATAGNGEQALSAIRKDVPDLVLLDLQMPKMGGLEVLCALRKEEINIPVVVITAFDIVVRKALEREGLKRELELFSEDATKRYHLVLGKSEKMKEAVETARKAATSKATVLLLGESGTGKEIFARAIHNWSERRSQPFVAINCVGLSKGLLESELFGHEKGAFTGADQLKKGKMELANGGTVFLDEIGDVTQELQTKLLRFLQEREFDRVGGVRPIHVDVRIVAATNRDLDVGVKEGRFREDLYHRLNVVPIMLPPLRERREDIPVLAKHFLKRFADEVKKNLGEISEEALGKLSAYEWPGNVRELANVIERAVVLGQGLEIASHDLPARIVDTQSETQSDGISYRDAMDAYRRQLMMRALAQSQGNRAAAARALGLHEKYFLRLLKSLGIGA
jgi:DNA-binding NtrC family response regulator